MGCRRPQRLQNQRDPNANSDQIVLLFFLRAAAFVLNAEDMFQKLTREHIRHCA